MKRRNALTKAAVTALSVAAALVLVAAYSGRLARAARQQDNSPLAANPNQKDADFNHLGDACDPDDDNDGTPDEHDPCPFVANPGAPCDDFDKDGVTNDSDNCQFTHNPGQYDSDNDGEGNACETDSDNDAVPNDTDNCPVAPNSAQTGSDRDGFGDVCDRCPAAPDPVWAYKPDGTPFQPDSNDDGVPDVCDNSWTVDAVPCATSVKPDNRPHDLSVEVLDHLPQLIPVEVCRRGDCPEWFAENYRAELSVVGLAEGAHVWVIDDEGGMAAKATGPPERRSLWFAPAAGRRYYLAVAAQTRSSRGAGVVDTAARLSFRLKASVKARQ